MQAVRDKVNKVLIVWVRPWVSKDFRKVEINIGWGHPGRLSKYSDGFYKPLLFWKHFKAREEWIRHGIRRMRRRLASQGEKVTSYKIQTSVGREGPDRPRLRAPAHHCCLSGADMPVYVSWNSCWPMLTLKNVSIQSGGFREGGKVRRRWCCSSGFGEIIKQEWQSTLKLTSFSCKVKHTSMTWVPTRAKERVLYVGPPLCHASCFCKRW